MYSQCSVLGASLNGVEALPVTVEVAVSSGMPGIWIVGMADKAVQEARERVKSALKASGFSTPASKIVVNLAPGDLKKGGSGFDLPIALGILVATGQIPPAILENRMFVGELSLEGSVRDVAGSLAYAVCAARLGVALAGAPRTAAPVEGLDQEELRHLVRLHREDALEGLSPEGGAPASASTEAPDFKDVAGHETAKRALQIAAAGNHGLLMVGTPGSGKTMLASRIPSILPPLDEDEMLEAALVHSVAGEDVAPILAGMRPFRNPHHSATAPGLLGGGSPIRPGEVSLAHCGVLFLDELAEFRSSVLQGLRQPVEDGEVFLTRAAGNVRMPARFMLIAATNPCPCGYYGDDNRECHCAAAQIKKYQSRVGGPLIDRFDLQLDIHRLPTSEVMAAGSGTSSDALREGVMRAMEFSSWRASRDAADAAGKAAARKGVARERDTAMKKGGAAARGRQGAKSVISECRLSDEAERFVVSMADSSELSARALVNSLRVARTIADMEESPAVTVDHLAEAFGFRLSDCFGA